MKISKAMRSPAAAITSDASISDAVDLMLWAAARHAPVVDNGKLVGVISETDVLRYTAEHPDKKLKDAPISTAMSSPAQYIHPDDTVAEASARMMTNRINCLPVIRTGELIGIITSTDLLALQTRQALGPSEKSTRTAAELMTQKPLSVRGDDPLETAFAKMAEAQIRHLPVVDDDGRLVGLLRDRDVRLSDLLTQNDPKHLSRLRVATAMSEDVVTISPKTSLPEIVTAFTDWRVSSLHVVDEDRRLVGVLSYVDVIRALA